MLTAAVCVALSGAGLATALLTGWRRRFRRAVRLASVSLLPVGLYLAGLITLGSRIGRAVGDWSADLVFKPSVWLGFAVMAVAVVLYLVTRLGAGGRREPGKRDAGRTLDERASSGGSKGGSLPGESSAPAIAPARTSPAAPKAKRAKGGAPASEFEDVEAILRKHGI